MRIGLIAAMAENRVIGRGNALPWHISADLRNFRRLTLGKPIVMGRKTFESLGKPLPGRANIVITRNPASRPSFRPGGVTVCHDIDGALAAAREIAGSSGADEIMVIGGAEVYAATLPAADRLYLTLVDAEFDGDAFFPAFDPAAWTEVARDRHEADAPDSPAYSFIVLERAI